MKLSQYPEIRERQERMLENAKKLEFRVKPVVYKQPNYATMPLENLKALKEKSDEWLKLNKGHKDWNKSKKRANKLSFFLTERMG